MKAENSLVIIYNIVKYNQSVLSFDDFIDKYGEDVDKKNYNRSTSPTIKS